MRGRLGSTTYSVLFDGRAVRAQDQLLGCRRELCEASDGQIFVVEVGIVAQDLVGLLSV